MSRILLLLILFLTASTTLSFGQLNKNILKRATNFAVLAGNEVRATGSSGVNGHIGVKPGGSIIGRENIKDFNFEFEEGTAIANGAYTDAQAAYNQLLAQPAAPVDFSRVIFPGVYRVNGDFNLNTNVTLSSLGNPEGIFVFIVTGNIETFASNGSIVTTNDASPDKIFWVVQENVTINSTTGFMGSILARGDITLQNGVGLVARAISIDGNVNLHSSSISAPISYVSDVAITKTAPALSYKIGDEITYTLTAINKSAGAAYNVVVNDIIPAGLNFLSFVKPEGTDVVVQDGKIKWTIPSLDFEERQELKLTFLITGEGVTEQDGIIRIVNKAVISSKYPDPDNARDDNETQYPVEVPALNADLSITKTADKATYVKDETVIYTITVVNNGPYDAKGVVITDRLPAGLELISGSNGYDASSGTFTLGDMAVGDTKVVTLSAKIVGEGTISNTATVIGNDEMPDRDLQNNTATAVITVECTKLTEFNLAADKLDLCQDDTLVVTAPLLEGYTYVFKTSGGVALKSSANNTATVQAGASSGVITVIATDPCGNEYSASLQIRVTPRPVPVIEGGDILCQGSQGNQFSASVSGGDLGYKWTATGGLTITSDANASTVSVNAAATGGTLTLEVTNGCFTVTTTKTIEISLLPAAPTAIVGDVDVCEGAERTYSVAEVERASSYRWSLPEGWTVVGPENGREITVKVGAAGGKISVTAINDCGNGTTVTKDVKVVEQPTPANFSLTGQTALCEGATGVKFTATPVPGATYRFTTTGGITLVSSDKNEAVVAAGATGGTVSVTVTDLCGRTLTVTETISVTPELAAPAIAGEDAVCRSSTGNTFTASAYDTPVTYKWTASGGLTIASGENSRTVTVNAGTTGGTLTLEVSNENGCFTVTATKVVNTIALPTLPNAITGPADLCEGETRTYSAPAVAGVAYSWSVPAGDGWAIIGESNNSEVSIKIGTKGGSITLTTADACGLISNTVSLPITVTNKPVAPAIASSATTGCIGATLTFSIEAPVAGYTYTWAVPQGWSANTLTGTSITVTVGETSGNIEVYATNTVKNCGAGAVTKLAVAPTLKPAAPGAISSNMNVCINSKGNAFSIAAVPGADSYEWEVTGGLSIEGANNGTSITVAAAETGGTVRVRAINGCGMSDWTTLNIEITMPPAPVTRITDNSSVCEGLIFTADAVAGATSYNWTVTEGFTIESGQGTTTIKVKASSPNATGRVSVIAYNGSCVGSGEYSIEIDAQKADGQLEFPKAFSPNGDGKNDEWVVKNLDKFADNEIVIFNRWGSEVYKQKSYKNDWAAKGLEQGTYFYKVRVKLCDGVYKDYSGYVTIFR